MVYVIVFGLFLVALLTQMNAMTSMSTEQCLEFGYNPEKLSCATCKQSIAKIFTEQHEIYEKCMTCCQEETQSSAGLVEESFAKAVLMVDKAALKFLPDIDYMVKNKKKYNITVKYRYGPPQLALYKEVDDDDPSDFLSIHNWTKDTIIEYLTSHVVSNAKDSNKGDSGDKKAKKNNKDKEKK